MFRFPILILAFLHLCVGVSLSNQWEILHEKHSWVNIPRGWKYLSPAPTDMSFDLRIGLKQGNIEGLISSLLKTNLAAQAVGFQVVIGGRVKSIGGTSASSPAVAGIFALLNDVLIAKGKPSLGFINPLIYSTASGGFNDIIRGSNPGCGTKGFSAGKGWDPVTGLGTPNFMTLKSIVSS